MITLPPHIANAPTPRTDAAEGYDARSPKYQMVDGTDMRQLERQLLWANELLIEALNELEFRKNIIESLDGNMPTVLGDEAANACIEQTKETIARINEYKQGTKEI